MARLVERGGAPPVTVVGFAVEIDATPEEVWAVVSDPRNLPAWDRHIVAVEDVPAEGLGPGVEYTTVMRFMAVRARIHGKILEWEPPIHCVVKLSGLLVATVITRVRPLRDGRSELEHEVDYHFHGGPLGEIAARSIRLVGGAHFALRHGVLAQKRQIEGG